MRPFVQTLSRIIGMLKQHVAMSLMYTGVEKADVEFRRLRHSEKLAIGEDL